MKLWPDLSRFGFNLGILYRVDGDRSVADGLFLDAVVRGAFEKADLDALQHSGFAKSAVSDLRLESSIVRFGRADIERWFPGFEWATDMRPRHPVMEQSPAAADVVLEVTDVTAWPRQADIDAADGISGLHGWERRKSEFEDLAAARVLRYSDSGEIFPANHQAFAEIIQAVGGEGSLLNKVRLVAREALQHADVAVIGRIGDLVLMPALRVLRDGDSAADQFGDHRRLVVAASESREIPVSVREDYQDVLGEDFGEDADLGKDGGTQVVGTLRQRRQKPVESKIVDVGEKVGGARKDFYRKALSVEDLGSMTAMERKDLVKKANVWPWSIKTALDNGAEPSVVQWIKTLRRHIAEFGENGSEENSDPALYIHAVGLLRDAVGEPRTKAELFSNLQAFRLRLYEEGEWVPFKHPVTGERLGNSQFYAQSFKPTVLACGWKAMDMVDYSLWPGNAPGVEPSYSITAWRSSKAERFENDPAYGRLKLLPVRRTAATDDELQMPERPHLANLEFSGFADARGGRDVEARELLTTFGFRGIEFGNWVPQDERQTVINFAFDAMHALCETLGVERQMAGLYGALALAFGSRGRGGKGAALAHYEPGRTVVNLTRIKGAGSLAHEWFHAFDNYLGEMLAGKPGVYLSDYRQPPAEWLRDPEELKEGRNAEYAQGIDDLVKSRKLFGERSWRESAAAIAKVLSSIRAKAKTPDQIIAETTEFAAVRFDWAASWFRYEIAKFFAGDGTGPNAGTARADGAETARQILEGKVAEYERLQWSGQWQAFDADAVAEDISSELRSDYRIRLGQKADKNMRGCLRAASRAQGLIKMRSLSMEERKARFSHVPASAFELSGVTESDFLSEAKKLDKTRSKPYWATDRELLARAGEQYMFYRMQQAGCRADYLVHGVEEDRYANGKCVGNPYPAGAERVAIEESMEKLMVAGCEAIRSQAAVSAKATPSVGLAA